MRTPIMWNCIFLSVFVFTSLNLTSGQSVINIEKKRMQMDSIGWAGDVSLGLIANKYKESSLSMYSNAHIQHNYLRNWYLLIGSIRFVKAGDQDFVDDGFLHFRYNRKVSDFFSLEAFTQIQFNKILGVEERVLVGAGPRFTIVNSNTVILNVGPLYMHEYEKNSPPETEIQRNHRMTIYCSLDLEINDRIDVAGAIYYQPLISDFTDKRVTGDAELQIEIGKKLHFFVRYFFLHDSHPALDTPNDTWSFSNGLKYNF